MLLAHAQPVALASAVGTDIARAVTDTPALTYTHGGTLTAAVLAFVADHYHQHRLCPRCAAATPEDGPAAAQRHPHWLRLHHWAGEQVGYALILLFTPIVALGLGLPRWVSYPVYVLWALVAYANLVHRPVEPWCPRCQGWGWDDRETDPLPPPTPATGATR